MNKKIISLLSSIKNNTSDDQLQKIYDEIYADAKPKILKQEFLKSIHDTKYEAMRGLALLIDFSELNSKVLQSFINELQQNEPAQTYNKFQNYHHTCFIFRFFDKAQMDTVLTPEIVEKCQLAVEKVIKNFPAFPIKIQGVTSTNNTLMAQGYSHGAIAELRKRIIEELQKLDVSVSKQSQLNHISLMRMTAPLTSSKKMVETIDNNRATLFGEFMVKSLKFVVNNYFNEPEHSVVLAEYPLVES